MEWKPTKRGRNRGRRRIQIRRRTRRRNQKKRRRNRRTEKKEREKIKMPGLGPDVSDHKLFVFLATFVTPVKRFLIFFDFVATLFASVQQLLQFML